MIYYITKSHCIDYFTVCHRKWPTHWVIPENIHTPQQTAFWNSEGKEGSLNWNSECKVGGELEGLGWMLPVHKLSMTE